MRYHNITTDDMNNGDGLRTVLWLAGCEHRCEGCQNPLTWDANGGLPFDEAAEEEVMRELRQPYISGLTLSGGDPLFPANRDDVLRLVRRVRAELPSKTIWLYTGYLWEKICALDVVMLVDVLVDGPFLKDRFDAKLHWKGSDNQRVIDVPQTLRLGQIVLHNT